MTRYDDLRRMREAKFTRQNTLVSETKVPETKLLSETKPQLTNTLDLTLASSYNPASPGALPRPPLTKSSPASPVMPHIPTGMAGPFILETIA